MRRWGRLVGLAMAVVLASSVAMLGPSLFLAIPWRIRWWMGEVALIGGIVLAYGWALRASPPRPWPILDPLPLFQRTTHRVLAVLLQLVTATFAYPLFAHPANGGMYDWDLYSSWFEAARIAILRYHEFPWWNPYLCGGFPLAADPQVGLLSIDLPLVLAFGTSQGLRLATVLSLMLAIEGARRLARLWLSDPWAVALAAAVYGWNGSISWLASVNPGLSLSHPLLPWLLLFAFRLDRGTRPAVGLGVVAALGVLAIIQYATAYGSLIAAAVVFWGGVAQPRAQRLRYVALLGVALGTFLTLAGWRLALSGQVLYDFPRRMASSVDNSPWELVHAMLDRPVPTLPIDMTRPGIDGERAAYLGFLPLFAAILSLLGPWRWWHTLTFVGFALALGATRVNHLSYWLSEWPGFATMHMVARWKLPAFLGLGLAAGSTLQHWRTSSRLGRRLAPILVVLTLADLATYAHQILPIAFDLPPAGRLDPGPPVEPMVSLQSWEDGMVILNFEAVRRGYGVVEGYCPMHGYQRHNRKIARLWKGHPSYLGEFVSEGQPLTPKSWSPNRVTFNGLDPGQVIEINQNPSSYWVVNGRRPFPRDRCAEISHGFLATADDRGLLVLEARPSSKILGLAAGVTAAGVALVLVAVLVTTRPIAR